MAANQRPRFLWSLRTRTLLLGERTLVMGIVNVTPDSFSDGGAFATTDAAVEHGLRLLDEGADILDIGGESTRPGSTAATSEALSAEEEQRRVLPVIDGLLRKRPDAMLSIDTYRASTATAAVQAGAEIVNDVSGGLWDGNMLRTVAGLECGSILMHTRGLPQEWATQPRLASAEVLPAVKAGLQERTQAALEAGVQRERMLLDPGFGFGKRGEENWALLAGFAQLHALHLPLMAGLSRKGFLESALSGRQGRFTASPDLSAGHRDDLTHTADALAIHAGAHIVRVHDVRGAVRSADVADALLNAR